mmetsp:Transcript_3656/g.3782  ORF Transcript_3656/g.3782 Transcript_3656/m.3782 type:complete len:218 (-) Transcript_3656:145-798(-)|eukprot:CAMPEP_0182416980 /NCGR_PEP_ID=MMETSP1167-20130531/1404_1 /TAXON_ID=2988 /ORGANISM="Mallomonas Sp, Strain CCMP3275" /LENGTH=217 /DNA_ID=CAMNT_0024590213 /DNA_START=62 /DNA_END=715 /DNA_ORIENTATION=-
MIYQVAVAFCLALSASAFAPAARANTRSSLQMSLFPENPTGLGGVVAPTGYFDPLNLAAGKDEATLKQWREAEIKHGRVCMLAAVGLLTQEITKNPLGIDGPAIDHFQLVDDKFPEFWVMVLTLCAFIEAWTIKKVWEPRAETKNLDRFARLREDAAAGDYGWDPLGWYPEDPAAQEVIKTKELQNGRLAMLGVAGIWAQELSDGKEILCHFQKVCE